MLLLLLLIYMLNVGFFSTQLHALDFTKGMDGDPFDSKTPDFTPANPRKPKKRTALSDVPYPELKKEKERLISKGKKYDAIKYLERMVAVCNDPKESCIILLELADVYFDLADYQKAEKTYQEFALLYPGNTSIEYVHYRTIVCSFYLTLDPERDQTKTQDTLKLTQEFLKKSEFITHKKEIETIALQCHEKLLQSDMNIVSFYIGRKQYKSAHTRLNNIIKEFKMVLPTHEPEILELRFSLAIAENNLEDQLKTQWELAQQFADHDITKRLVPDIPALTIQIAALETPKEQPKETITLAQATPQEKPKLVNRF